MQSRSLVLLPRLVLLGMWVSVVHYVDNTVNYSAYPTPTSGPSPSAAVVGGSWFVFTPIGMAGLLLLRRGNVKVACACLAFYSLSGIVGLGHYTVPGATAMPWWRQAHIIADIACGVAILMVSGCLWITSSRGAREEATPRMPERLS